MLIPNNTHYFTINSKLYNNVPDTCSWEFECSKRQSYTQRLYWEYQYCKSVGGQAFFYTFTYNDSSLPHYDCKRMDSDTGEWNDYSFPCFSYEHIRLLTNGLISKVLRRQYGSQMRYFVACERGEGKGLHRKKGMNPHYHVIFFVFPLDLKIRKDKDVDYKPIPPGRFLHLCRSVWQYKSKHDRSYKKIKCDYKSARFGHCQPGDNCGLITDFDALSYVSKYVVKDSVQYSDDWFVKSYYQDYVIPGLGYTTHSVYYYYLYLRSTGAVIDRQDFLDVSGLSHYILYRSCMSLSKQYSNRHQYDFLSWLGLQHPEYDEFWNKEFAEFFNRVYVPHLSDFLYRDYVNNYGAKVRTSKSLGLYGLQFVNNDMSNPHFVIRKSDSVVTQPICLYYYRKLYMNVEICPRSGNPLYVLNDKGVQLRCNNLSNSLKKRQDYLHSALDFYFSNLDNVDYMSLCDSVGLTRSDVSLCTSVVSERIAYIYSVYSVVYQYRHYCKPWSFSLDWDCTFEKVLSDYRLFLSTNYYTCDYEDCCMKVYYRSCDGRNIESFRCHSAFRPYVKLFDLLDKLIDVMRQLTGDIKRKEFADSQSHRQSLSAYRYSQH